MNIPCTVYDLTSTKTVTIVCYCFAIIRPYSITNSCSVEYLVSIHKVRTRCCLLWHNNSLQFRTVFKKTIWENCIPIICITDFLWELEIFQVIATAEHMVFTLIVHSRTKIHTVIAVIQLNCYKTVPFIKCLADKSNSVIINKHFYIINRAFVCKIGHSTCIARREHYLVCCSGICRYIFLSIISKT